MAQRLPEDWVPSDSFAARLALLRVELGLNIAQAAQRCGVAKENWRRWERGVVPHDLNAVARRIADAVGCRYEWLVLGGPLGGPSPPATPIAGRRRRKYAAGDSNPEPSD